MSKVLLCANFLTSFFILHTIQSDFRVKRLTCSFVAKIVYDDMHTLTSDGQDVISITKPPKGFDEENIFVRLVYVCV